MSERDDERPFLDAAERGLRSDLDAGRVKRRIRQAVVTVLLFGAVETIIVLAAVRCAQ
jgi:hypothetical protein